jgi:hypothetical protein
MTQFQSGDRVRCITNYLLAKSVQKGMVYVVERVLKDGTIVLTSDRSKNRGWNARDFEHEDPLIESLISIQNANAQPTPR